MASHYTVIGMMSGTSLDGVDLACLYLKKKGKSWSYRLMASETISYSKLWKKRLEGLINSQALDYAQTHCDLGHLFAGYAKRFISQNNLKPDLIASHGHTIFHQPSMKLTAQIGEGSAIAALTGIPVVCDFRSTDLAKGGQGAPLVPIGDWLLFGNYHYCLNLGGIANISYDKKGERIAFDICPVNMAMNYVAGLRNKPYDVNGIMASRGIADARLLKKMNSLAFYRKKQPKSLGAEWFNLFFKPLIESSRLSPEDLQATLADHIVLQLKKAVETGLGQTGKTMLLTGGGAHNRYLVMKMKESLKLEVIVPGKDLVDFKEAIIFALLGVLRWRQEINTLCSVTGANENSSSGAIYLP